MSDSAVMIVCTLAVCFSVVAVVFILRATSLVNKGGAEVGGAVKAVSSDVVGALKPISDSTAGFINTLSSRLGGGLERIKILEQQKVNLELEIERLGHRKISVSGLSFDCELSLITVEQRYVSKKEEVVEQEESSVLLAGISRNTEVRCLSSFDVCYKAKYGFNLDKLRFSLDFDDASVKVFGVDAFSCTFTDLDFRGLIQGAKVFYIESKVRSGEVQWLDEHPRLREFIDKHRKEVGVDIYSQEAPDYVRRSAFGALEVFLLSIFGRDWKVAFVGDQDGLEMSFGEVVESINNIVSDKVRVLRIDEERLLDERRMIESEISSLPLTIQ